MSSKTRYYQRANQQFSWNRKSPISSAQLTKTEGNEFESSKESYRLVREQTLAIQDREQASTSRTALRGVSKSPVPRKDRNLLFDDLESATSDAESGPSRKNYSPPSPHQSLSSHHRQTVHHMKRILFLWYHRRKRNELELDAESERVFSILCQHGPTTMI